MGRPPIGKHAMTDAERQRKHRDKLPKKSKTFRDSDHVTKLEARIKELEALASLEYFKNLFRVRDLQARNRELEGENSALRQQAEASAAAKPKPSAKGDAARIKELERWNAKLVAENLTLARELGRQKLQTAEAPKPPKAKIPRATFNAVVNCLHPDKPQPTEKRRAEVYGLFMDWYRKR